MEREGVSDRTGRVASGPVGAMRFPLSLATMNRWLTESQALDESKMIKSTALPSSSHFVTNSSGTRRFAKADRCGSAHAVARKTGANGRAFPL